MLSDKEHAAVDVCRKTWTYLAQCLATVPLGQRNAAMGRVIGSQAYQDGLRKLDTVWKDTESLEALKAEGRAFCAAIRALIRTDEEEHG